MQNNDVVPGSQEDRDINRFESGEFPNWKQALTAVKNTADSEGATVYAIQVGILASGEVTYKLYIKESDETVSGVLALEPSPS